MGHSLQLQTILMDKDLFSLKQARAWLKKHDYKRGVDSKGEFYHFRQLDPHKGAIYVTKKIAPGIEFVLFR